MDGGGDPIFGHWQYSIKQRQMSFGRQFSIFGPDGTQVLTSARTMRLRCLTDMDGRDRVGSLARKLFTVQPTYDLSNLDTQANLGVICRPWVKSMFQRQWEFIEEWEGGRTGAMLDTRAKSLFTATGWFYEVFVGGMRVAQIDWHASAVARFMWMELFVSPDEFDRRIAIMWAVEAFAQDGVRRL